MDIGPVFSILLNTSGHFHNTRPLKSVLYPSNCTVNLKKIAASHVTKYI